MTDIQKTIAWRLLPVVLLVATAGVWFGDVQQGGPFVMRNLVPLGFLIALSGYTLFRGDGRWTGAGKKLPLGLIGYSIPALGLAVYIHYAYSVNLNGMFSDAVYPQRVFRYLPLYTTVAGGIGFAIGRIAGRNI